MRRVFVPVLVVMLVALTAGTTQAAAFKPRPHVVLRGQDHHPRVGKPWSYSVRVTTPSGKPLSCRIHLQILFGGTPVGQIGVHVVKNGVWKETIGKGANEPFPAAARGQHLVLQAIVTVKGYATAKVGWSITVR